MTDKREAHYAPAPQRDPYFHPHCGTAHPPDTWCPPAPQPTEIPTESASTPSVAESGHPARPAKAAPSDPGAPPGTSTHPSERLGRGEPPAVERSAAMQAAIDSGNAENITRAAAIIESYARAQVEAEHQRGGASFKIAARGWEEQIERLTQERDELTVALDIAEREAMGYARGREAMRQERDTAQALARELVTLVEKIVAALAPGCMDCVESRKLLDAVLAKARAALGEPT